MSDYHLLFEEDGTPAGFLDLEMVATEGLQLAFRMAADCQNREPVNHVDLFTRVGPDGFTWVLLRALNSMAELLDNTLTSIGAAGLEMRSEIRATAKFLHGDSPTN